MNRSYLKKKIYAFVLIVIFFPGPWEVHGQSQPASDAATEGASRQLIHDAAHAVDEAWEEFHRAAIGGTLASPAVQTQIERQLHEARGLLMEARKAEKRGDHRSVKTMTDKLFTLSHEIILASREKKP